LGLEVAVAEGVPRIEDISAHSVGMGGAGLVALAPGGAGHAHVPNIDFVSVGPTVALLVPEREKLYKITTNYFELANYRHVCLSYPPN
jgi:hypothetical protein